MSGELTLNTNLNQCWRNNGHQVQGFKYPITQVENIKSRLHLLLERRKIAPLPIYYFVAFTDTSMVYHVVGDEVHVGRVVSYVEDIPTRIMKLNQHLQENHPNRDGEQRRNQMVTNLIAFVENFDIDVFREFDLSKSDILPGIHCESCHNLFMERRNHNWNCQHCGATSKSSHQKALQDYYLLFGPEMTNEKLRYFFQVRSRHTIKKVLQHTKSIKKHGERKWKIHPR